MEHIIISSIFIICIISAIGVLLIVSAGALGLLSKPIKGEEPPKTGSVGPW